MNKPKLIYFDAPVSRWKKCHLALHVAGVDFEGVRIKSADWRAVKERMPYGNLPVLKMSGGRQSRVGTRASRVALLAWPGFASDASRAILH